MRGNGEHFEENLTTEAWFYLAMSLLLIAGAVGICMGLASVNL